MATTNYITGLNGTDNTTYYLNEGVDTRFFRGTCSTARGTAAKTVTLDDSTNFSLTAGVKVAVTFINGSVLTSRNTNIATLNVNSTGAKTIIFTPDGTTNYNSTSVIATYDGEPIYIPIMECQPYETIIFIYNGSYWVQNSISPVNITGAISTAITNQDRLEVIAGSNNIVRVSHGGTGVSSFTKNSVVISGSTSTSALTTTAAGNSGEVLMSNGSDAAPTWTSKSLVQIVRW